MTKSKNQRIAYIKVEMMNEYQEKRKTGTGQVSGEVFRQGSDQRRRVRRPEQTSHSQNRTFQSRDLAHQPQGTYRAEYIPKSRKTTNRENISAAGTRRRSVSEMGRTGYPSAGGRTASTRRRSSGTRTPGASSGATGNRTAHSSGSARRRVSEPSYRSVERSRSVRAGERAGRKLEELEILEQENERDYQEYLERKRKRQERKRREEEAQRRRRRLMVRGGGAGLIAVILIIVVYRLFFSNPVLRTVTVEAGAQDFQTADFLRRDVDAEFVTDMSQVDTSHVGEQKVVLDAGGKERTSTLVVQDTTAPKAQPETAMINIDGDLSADELVTDIDDATDVTCSFKEKPDLSQEGTVPVTVILTDEGGNTAEVDSEVEVIVDTEPPVIDGVAPLEGFIGDPVSYKSEITVTDNCDKEVDLEVDNSDVDTETPGTYDVRYTATDKAGNTAEAETTITIKEKPDNYVEPEEVYAEADEVLAEITTDDMTLKEKARAIYDWCRANIGYISTSDKDSWTNGAHQGFTQHQGDCFIFFSTAKALLTEADIPNIDVVKSDTSHSRHYWSLINCGDGWYHFDTTPRTGGGEFFMLTDEELLSYSASHNNSHIFDQSLYPATPTEDSTIE